MSLSDEFAEARAAVTPTPMTAAEATRVRDQLKDGRVVEKVTMIRCIEFLLQEQSLLAHFRKCADSGLMKDVGHSELAGRVRMLGRGDFDFEPILQAARDRIIWLADELRKAKEEHQQAARRWNPFLERLETGLVFLAIQSVDALAQPQEFAAMRAWVKEMQDMLLTLGGDYATARATPRTEDSGYPESSGPAAAAPVARVLEFEKADFGDLATKAIKVLHGATLAAGDELYAAPGKAD